MHKGIYIIALGTALALAYTCKTPQKTETTVPEQQATVKTPTEKAAVKEPEKPVYIPPPKDSVSEISINLVGDLMCHLPQTNNARLKSGDYDFSPSFEYVKPYLQDADLTIGNLETTFAGTGQPYAGYPAFNSPDAYCKAIKDAGFDFLVTANNHSMDTREAGLLRTIKVIKEQGLGYAGTYLDQRDHDSIRILNVKGIRLAILNYTYGTNGSYPASDHKYMLNVIDSAGVVAAVKAAKDKGSDMVLVFYHMGVENVVEPTQSQKDAVRFALQAGAALVIGAHPHMVGPTKVMYSEQRKDSVFIAYSLGNFLSNQYWRYTDAGVILKLVVQKNHTKQQTSYKAASFTPTWVYRGDGGKKMHVIFPAQLYADTIRLPAYLNASHRQKMEEAFDDTKRVFTRYNPYIYVGAVK
jgi:poly-gamma-glutamate capsule biosynthesis protein CapA/YwtB (metallophosphatase superfamily)